MEKEMFKKNKLKNDLHNDHHKKARETYGRANLKDNSQGYALIITIMIVAVVVTSTSALLFALNSELRLNQAAEQREKANYLAQAGIEHGLSVIEEGDVVSYDRNQEHIVMTVGNLEYRYRITTLEDNQIISVGWIVVDGERTQEVTIAADIVNGNVTSVRQN